MYVYRIIFADSTRFKYVSMKVHKSYFMKHKKKDCSRQNKNIKIRNNSYSRLDKV